MDNIYERIDNLSNEQSRAEITSYLKALLPALSGDLERSTSAAYAIAGLMATTYAHNLKDDDPIDEILYTGIQGLTLEPKNLIQGLTLELSSIHLGDVAASTIVLFATGEILPILIQPGLSDRALLIISSIIS